VTDYKDTLNLPKTAFPMRANLAQREPKMLEQWYAQDIYGELRRRRAGREKFVLLDGPPYANGQIHLGHAVNKVLKDIIIKSRTLSGYDAPYIPGWDCHGLPIELQVEKKKGKVGTKLNAREFRAACRQYALAQVDAQRQDFKRLGVFADWDRPYLTMDPAFEAEQVRGFGRIIDNGHLQRGYKPVHWCLDCGSALAEAEVEYQDKSSTAIDVRFTVVDVPAFYAAIGMEPDSENTPVSVPIWTTTPWTLPANQAVALGPDLDYEFVEVTIDGAVERLVLASGLVENALQRYGAENVRRLTALKGIVLQNLQLAHPFDPRNVPIILTDYVTLEAGTGAVHTAPGHGHDDFSAGLDNDLPLDNPVDGRGVYIEGTHLFAGMHIYKANDQIVTVLADDGKLLCVEKVKHSYPHCWRHDTPVIFRATPQWFVSLDKNNLRAASLAEIERVEWIPSWGKRTGVFPGSAHGVCRSLCLRIGRPTRCIRKHRVCCGKSRIGLKKRGLMRGSISIRPSYSVTKRPNTRRSWIRWMSGWTPGWFIIVCHRAVTKSIHLRICISKVPTSTVAGFKVHC